MATQVFLPTKLWSGKQFDGQWSAGGPLREVVEPATAAVLGQVALADPGQVARSAAAAAQVQRAWADAPYETRAGSPVLSDVALATSFSRKRA